MSSGIDFAEWLARRKSENTTKAYTYWLLRYATEYDASNTNESQLISFFENNPNLVVAGMIKNLCAYLKLPRPNLDYTLLKKSKKLPKYYEEQEARWILQEFERNTDYPEALWLMIECGLRISEVVGLRYDDIKFSESRILIKGKGSKERTAYPSPELLKALLTRRNNQEVQTPYVFPNATGEAPITPEAIRYHLRRIKTGAQPHTFRHTFATNLLKNSVSLRTIQKALGHESPETTSIYAHVFDEDLAAANKKVWLKKQKTIEK